METVSKVWEFISDNLVEIFTAFVFLIVIIGIGAAIFGAIANEQNAIDSGIIVDKNMTPGGTYYNSSKHGGHLQSYPASYSFTIRGEKNGEMVQYTFNISEDEYNSYKIGEEYHR